MSLKSVVDYFNIYQCRYRSHQRSREKGNDVSRKWAGIASTTPECTDTPSIGRILFSEEPARLEKMAYQGYGAAPGGFPPGVRKRTEPCREGTGHCPTRCRQADRKADRQTDRNWARSSSPQLRRFTQTRSACVGSGSPRRSSGELWEHTVDWPTACLEILPKSPTVLAEVWLEFIVYLFITLSGRTGCPVCKPNSKKKPFNDCSAAGG